MKAWLVFLAVLFLPTVVATDFELRQNCIGDAELSNCGVGDEQTGNAFIGSPFIGIVEAVEDLILPIVFGVMAFYLIRDVEKQRGVQGVLGNVNVVR